MTKAEAVAETCHCYVCRIARGATRAPPDAVEWANAVLARAAEKDRKLARAEREAAYQRKLAQKSWFQHLADWFFF